LVPQVLARTDDATAHAGFGSHVGKYTYGDEDCTPGEERDPINVLFVRDGFYDQLDEHMEHHGLSNEDGSSQGFLDHGSNCYFGFGDDARTHQRATSGFGDRLHIRYHSAMLSPAFQHYDYDPNWWYYAVGDAHEEEYVTGHGCGFPGNHAVWDNVNEGGGFNRGKVEILERFTQGENEHAVLAQALYLDNRNPMAQCDANWETMTGIAWSDGYTVVISGEHEVVLPPPSSGGGGSSSCNRTARDLGKC
jgi:hypothetical protein